MHTMHGDFKQLWIDPETRSSLRRCTHRSIMRETSRWLCCNRCEFMVSSSSRALALKQAAVVHPTSLRLKPHNSLEQLQKTLHPVWFCVVCFRSSRTLVPTGVCMLSLLPRDFAAPQGGVLH